ncbi:MAG: hypothetical protein K8I02_11800, partial [Candidatus Methylomirabilis sp.]|nr:hypothetical protein [Deltaproteobacteria bacterium]
MFTKMSRSKPYALAARALAPALLLLAGCGNSQPPKISSIAAVPLTRDDQKILESAVVIPNGGFGTVARSPVILQGTITDNAAVGNPIMRMNAAQCVCGQLEACTRFQSLPRRERTIGLLLNPQNDLFEVTVQLLSGDPAALDPNPACGDPDDPARLRVRYDMTINAEDPPDQGEPVGRRAIGSYTLIFDAPDGAEDAEPPVLSFFFPRREDLDLSLSTTPLAPPTASQLLQAVIRDNSGEPARVRLGLCVPGDATHPPRETICSEAVRARCAANPEAFPRGCACKPVPADLCPSGFAVDDDVRLETDRLV